MLLKNMKTFFKGILTAMVFSIGYLSVIAYASLKGFHWYHWFLLLGSFCMTIPSVAWIRNYFDELFDDGKH